MNIFSKDSRWVKKATELKLVQQSRKEIEESEKQLLAELKDLSGFEPSKGGQFRFDYVMRKGSVEYKNIPELKNVDLEAYRKEEVQVWKLEIVLEA